MGVVCHVKGEHINKNNWIINLDMYFWLCQSSIAILVIIVLDCIIFIVEL